MNASGVREVSKTLFGHFWEKGGGSGILVLRTLFSVAVSISQSEYSQCILGSQIYEHLGCTKCRRGFIVHTGRQVSELLPRL